MNRLVPLLSLTLALLAAAPAQEAHLPGGPDGFERTLQGLAESGRQRTVLVYGLIGLGTGAVIDPAGRVVTNAHVAAGARYAVVQWADGHTTLMEREGIDYATDLALLRPAEALPGPVPCFELAARGPIPGQWVVALGYPGGRRGSPDATVSVGRVVEGTGGDVGPAGFLSYDGAARSDTPIFSGNSGGPMIDLEGRLVGINGAVNLEEAATLTIPIERVRARLQVLRGERIFLPRGLELDPGSHPALRGLYQLLDPLARRLPQQTAERSEAVWQGERPLEAPAPPLDPEAGLDADALAKLARKGPRQAPLDGALADLPAARAAVFQADGLLGTRVGPRHAVVKASALGNRAALPLPGGGQARVVATAREDDLALLLLPEAGPAPRPAPHRPVGSLVHLIGPDGITASGIVSVGPRPTHAALAAQIQSGGVPSVVLRGIALLERLGRSLRQEALRELARQLTRSLEVRRQFASGTPPRSYPEVISTDAPVPPSAAGAPLVDRDGQLLGVAIGVAHHGTAYAVPLSRIRQLFAAELGDPRPAGQRGASRLY